MRSIRSVLVVLGLAALLAACGSAGSALSPVGAPVDGVTGGYQAAPSGAPASEVPAGAEAPTGENANQVGARDDAKIIRTGSIELDVTDVGQALRVARNAIVALGGYVGASSTSNSDDRPTAEITYRIPSDRWEEALDALRDLNGLTTKVAREQTQAVEVTGQVVDLEARIRNLRASETALQGIAANATRVSDVLEVESRLTDVRGQIEQLTAALEALNDQASYATLTVYFRTPVVAVEVASNEWQPAEVVDEAAASLISILQGLATAGIWFAIVWVPSLALLAFLVIGAVWLGRRLGLRLPRRAEGTGAVADTWR
jgi:hypothetical protein